MLSYRGKIPSGEFEFKPGDMPTWAKGRMLEKLRENLTSYLRHEPARSIATSAAIPFKRLFPGAHAIAFLPELTSPKDSIGGITVGVEPLTDQWNPKNRYDMALRVHDGLSLLGLHSADEHEACHVRDTVSFAGLFYLLAFELKIAKHKPMGWDLRDLGTVMGEVLKRLRPAQKQPFETLTPQLEVEPTEMQLLALSSKEWNENLYRITGNEVCRVASEVVRFEYLDLFLKVLHGAGANEAHRRCMDLVARVQDKGVHFGPQFVSGVTSLGFLGLPTLLWLADKTGKKFSKALLRDDPETGFRVLLEVVGLSLEEYQRTLLRMLDEAVASTRGYSRERLRFSRTWAEAQMSRVPLFFGYGQSTCTLIRIGGKPYIQQLQSASDSEVEAFLAFYVDFGLASAVEQLVINHLKYKKPDGKILTCPLRGSIQPPSCPDCSGKLVCRIKEEKMLFEATRNLSQKCPFIKEWLGEISLKV